LIIRRYVMIDKFWCVLCLTV